MEQELTDTSSILTSLNLIKFGETSSSSQITLFFSSLFQSFYLQEVGISRQFFIELSPLLLASCHTAPACSWQSSQTIPQSVSEPHQKSSRVFVFCSPYCFGWFPGKGEYQFCTSVFKWKIALLLE